MESPVIKAQQSREKGPKKSRKFSHIHASCRRLLILCRNYFIRQRLITDHCGAPNAIDSQEILSLGLKRISYTVSMDGNESTDNCEENVIIKEEAQHHCEDYTKIDIFPSIEDLEEQHDNVLLRENKIEGTVAILMRAL